MMWIDVIEQIDERESKHIRDSVPPYVNVRYVNDTWPVSFDFCE